MSLPNTRPVSPVAAHGSPIESRDPYNLPNEWLTEHFAIRWGDDVKIDLDDLSRIAEAFEFSWDIEIEELGMPTPLGSDTSLFNVYIGDTGNGAPSSFGASGYYGRDSEDWPMIVLGTSTVNDSHRSLVTVAHEFFHALQDATGSYRPTTETTWYWEATATWMEGVVYPEDPHIGVYLLGFAFLPHYSLDYYDAFDTGAFSELYAYGAFIFPEYLTEATGDPSLVIESWIDNDSETNPLVRISSLLSNRNQTLNETIARFGAHTAVLDYHNGEHYQWLLDEYSTYPQYESFDHRVTATVSDPGTDGWARPPAATLPSRYGHNILVLDVIDTTEIVVSFMGEFYGSQSSRANWAATVVLNENGYLSYLDIDLHQHQGSLALPSTSPDTVVTVVVSALPEHAEINETFDYQYAVGPIPPEQVDTGDDPEALGACGCNTTPWNTFNIGLLLVGLVLLRRKRTIPLGSTNATAGQPSG